MSKYTGVLDSVFQIIKTAPFRVYPENFLNELNLEEYLRVSVIPSNKGINLRSASGIVIVDIFVPSNEGPKRLYTVADTLDTLFVGKSIGRTQFFQSGLTTIGQDENPSLYRGQYTIQFSYFEEF